MLTIILAAVVGQPFVAPPSTATDFYAPLAATGITPGSWPVVGATQPDTLFWGDDPDGTVGWSTWLATVTGAPIGVETPFCPSGSFASLTNCLHAVRFAVGDYYAFPAGVGDIATGNDFGFFAIFRVGESSGTVADPSVSRMVEYNGAAANGWYLSHNTYAYSVNQRRSESINFVHGAGTVTAESQYVLNGQGMWGSWEFICGGYDRGAASDLWLNGIKNLSVSGHADGDGTTHDYSTPAGVLTIGDSDGSYPFLGDVVVLGLHSTHTYTGAECNAIFNRFSGQSDTKGAMVLYEYSGADLTGGSILNKSASTNRCCQIGGSLQCFSVGWPMVGCAIPTGFTGAGTPTTGGLFSEPGRVSALIYTRDLNAIAYNSSTSTTSMAASPFGDGRKVWEYDVPNTGGELWLGTYYPYGTETSTLASQADNVPVVTTVWTRPTDTPPIKFGVSQFWQGVPYTSDYRVVAAATKDVWREDCFINQRPAAGDTYFWQIFQPSDQTIGPITGPGHVYAFFDTTFGTRQCPITYAESFVSVSAVGNDQLQYTITGKGFLDSSGNIKDNTEIEFTWTPIYSWVEKPGIIVQLDAGNDTQRVGVGIDRDARLYLVNGSNVDIRTTIQALSPTSPLTVKVTLNYTADHYALIVNGAIAGSSSTTRTSPTGVTTLRVGGNAALAGVPGEIRGVFVRRPKSTYQTPTALPSGSGTYFSASLSTSTTDTYGAPASFTNFGKPYCWKDSGAGVYKLYEFANGTPRFGCAIPPGLTGAGPQAAGGYFAEEKLQPLLFGSNTLDQAAGGGWPVGDVHSWDQHGTAPVACAQAATPFADARTTCKLTDDSAGTYEDIRQQIEESISGITTGTVLTACVSRYDTAASPWLINWDEEYGCTEINAITGNNPSSTTWSVTKLQYTVSNHTCKYVRLWLEPTATGANAETGTGNFALQVYNHDVSCASYIEVGCESPVTGGDALSWSVGPGGGFLDAAGAVADNTTISIDIVPLMATQTAAGVIWQLDDGTNSEAVTLGVTAARELTWTVTTGGVPHTDITTAVLTYVEGTAMTAVVEMNFTTDAYSITVDGGTPDTSAAARVSPSGLLKLRAGSDANNANQPNMIERNFTVVIP